MNEVSRSAIVTRKSCEMRRYKQYHFRKQGIQPRDFVESNNVIGLNALPKVRGAIFHNISLAIVEGAEKNDWVAILDREAEVLPASIRKVQKTLIRRAMLGWELIRGPWWKKEFDVISAEESWKWAITPEIYQPLRLDKILRRKQDKFLLIFDYKTMGSVDPNWPLRMEISDQTHTYIQALKERSGEWLLGMCYDGVVIGKPYKGIHKSPFVTGYLKNGRMAEKHTAGAETVDLCDFNDEKWLEWIHVKLGILKELYSTTGILNPPAERLLHTKNATGRAEELYHEKIALIEQTREHYGEASLEYGAILALLEKNPDSCYKYGVEYACPFVKQCWQGYPVDDDDFEPRINHHIAEDQE